MPGTKTHDAAIAITSPLLYIATDLPTTVAYVITGLLLSPDLDIHSHIFKRWGILRWYWIPYQKIIGHRSWLSHSGPISGLIRICYAFPILLALYTWLPEYVYPYIIGIMLSDSVHTILDIVSTKIKRSV